MTHHHHMLEDLTERDGWSVAVCACGAESPPCPDDVTAANFWGQHLIADFAARHQPLLQQDNTKDETS